MAARRPPNPQAWVRFLLLLPRRVSQVGRRLSAKQSNRRFDSDPRLHSGQHWCAGGPYKPVIAPDEGARQSSILWTTTKFTPPSFNGLGHHATNVETGVQILSGVPRLRARAAKRIGHQPPKLAICEFESHRAFHAGLI